MPPKSYKLWKALREDRKYLKPYKDFLEQFKTPEKQERLYVMLESDKLVTKPLNEYQQQFWGEITEEPVQNKYQGTSRYSDINRDTTKKNMALEKMFGDKYGDKNLWTRYAYLNQDEALKDMIIANENKIDPYTLAGALSGEGLVDELYYHTENDPYYNITDLDTDIYGTQYLGLDDFAGRYDEFKKKGLTSLEPYNESASTKDTSKYFVPYGEYIQETGGVTHPADFKHPQAGINAMSTYLKNIQNMVDEAGVQGTPEEKEFLVHVGYNYGEGGLKSYLGKSKKASVIISRIREEKPQVYKNAQKRVIVAKELRNAKSFEPVQKP